MSGERVVPGWLGIEAFWTLGSGGWKADMDNNLLMLSVFTQGRVKSRGTSLPGGTQGDVYIIPSGDTDGNKVAIRDNSAWVKVTPVEGALMWVIDEDQFVTFDGTNWVDGVGASALADAPSDGTTYGRKDGAWTALASANSRSIAAKSANYTLVAGDVDVKINAGHASNDITITVPQNSVAAIPIGAWIPIENTNVQDVTIAAGTGATLVNGPLTLAEGEVAILWKNTTNGFTVSKLGGTGGGGGGVSSFFDLIEVDFVEADLAEGNFPVWDDTANKFVVGTAPTYDLDDLTDAAITSPLAKNVLQYNGSAWVNAMLQLSDLASDIDLTGQVNGNVLTRVSGVWKPQAPSAGTVTEVIMIAVSDETTALSTGVAKVTFRMPYAFTLTGVKSSLTGASSSGLVTVDINEAGSTILSTKLSIDASERTSATAATAAVISDTALGADAEITIDIDAAGTGAKGLKVYLIGHQ